MRVIVLALTLTLFCVSLLPALGQQNCTPIPDTTLVYDANEPPPCPPKPSDIVPSTVGQPNFTVAIELAACAGLMDALVSLRPADAKRLISGDDFMMAALAQRERPSRAILEIGRTEAKVRTRIWLPDAIASGSSAVIHAYSMCQANQGLDPVSTVGWVSNPPSPERWGQTPPYIDFPCTPCYVAT
jgi:hypothetical protein